MTESVRRKLAAEAFGTCALVFAGTGAIVITEASGGAITHVGIGITFGLVVLAMIYAIGDVSGCHLNPAVTVDFLDATEPDVAVCRCVQAPGCRGTAVGGPCS